MSGGIFYPLGSAQAEELALRAGLKPAIRQWLTPRAAAAQRRRFERLGYRCGQHEVEGQALLVVARESDRVERGLALARLQARGEHADRRAAVREQGRLLGYPACCVEAFAAGDLDQPGPLSACRAALAATRGALRPRLNVLDLAVFHYLSWIPCRFDCAASAAYADALASLVARRYPVFVQRVDYALGAHRLVVGPGVQLSLRGVWRGAALVVDRAWSTAADRRPSAGAGARPEHERLAASLVRRIARQPLVEPRGDALWIGDEEVGRWDGLVMYPFGGRPPRGRPG